MPGYHLIVSIKRYDIPILNNLNNVVYNVVYKVLLFLYLPLLDPYPVSNVVNRCRFILFCTILNIVFKI